MRELYMYNSDVRNLLNPSKKETGLKELLHPERILNPTARYLKYPAEYNRDSIDMVTPIRCNLILTNSTHDGIWLIKDDKENSISIPNKIMGESILSTIKNDGPITAIYETIVKMLIDKNPKVNNYINDTIGITSLPMELKWILGEYNLNLLDSLYPIYYSFWNKDYMEELNIYMVKEVTEPFENTIPTLVNFNYYNFVWYSRKDHAYNMKAKCDRRALFYSEYEKDVRTDGYGICMLDKIFNESLFGKLDIY